MFQLIISLSIDYEFIQIQLQLHQINHAQFLFSTINTTISSQKQDKFNSHNELNSFSEFIFQIFYQNDLKFNIENSFSNNKQNFKFMKDLNQANRLSFQEEVYANNFKKEFHIIESPQIIDRICEIKHNQYKIKKEGCQQFKMDSLLKMNRGRSVKKISQNRQKFIEIKKKLANSIELINKNKQELTLSQIFLWKQNILTNFLQQFIEEISKQCVEKSDILQFIWNSTFNIIEYLVGVISKINKDQQKRFLSNILSNHTSYQEIIQNLTQKLQKRKDQMQQQQDFIKSLVYNLRVKRKQIKKLTKNLKLCTVKVNQIKNFYLDLQQQHIELLSQIRDISKENALNLIKRKQQIHHEKRKQYKLKHTAKKLRFEIQKEIYNQNINQKVNVQKLHDDLKSSFSKYYLEKRLKAKKGSSHSITQNIFESAMDDFNVRIEEIPGTEELLNFKTNIGFVDIMTDMDDFIRDEEEKQVQTTFMDKFTNDMINNKAIQTVQIKRKLIKFKQIGIQVNQPEFKGLKLSKRKVIDCSFLISDYRNKNLVLQKGTLLKLQLNPKFLNFLKQNHLDIDYKNQAKFQKQQKQVKQQITVVSFALQTNQVFLYDFAGPVQYKNQKLEQQINIYLEQIKAQAVNFNNKQNNQLTQMKHNFKSKKWVKGIKNRAQNATFHDFTSTTNDISKKSEILQLENNELKSERSTKILTSNTRISKSGQSLHRSSSNTNGLQMKKINRKKQFQTINQTSYQQLISNKKDNQKKFWVNKSGNKESFSLQKRKLLNDLGISSQLFNRVGKLSFTLNGQNLYQDRKLLQQLEDITEAFKTNQQLFESLKNHIHSNINILQQQLKKMLQTKKINRILAQSQRQRLSKIISLVFTYAYHLYFNHKMSINNLIIPLFHYFKIGYGQIKKNDLYLRMLYFLSQTICHQDQYYIFETFILFLGLNLNQKQTKKIKINKQNTCLFLRLLKGLSLNFKFPLNVEILYTTVGHAQNKCRQILMEEHYESNIIDKVIERVKGKLNTLVSNSQSSIEKNSSNQEYCQIKVNVFKCCQFIIQEIEKIRSMVYDSYLNLYEYFSTIEYLNQQEFVKYILRNMYLQGIEYKSKLKQINAQLSKNQNQKGLQKFIQIFISTNVPDFNKIYFLALSKFKIKQEFLYLSINRRLPFLMKYIEIHQQDLNSQHRLIKHIINRQQISILKQLANKKILALIYLQSVQNQVHNLLNSIIGTNLNELYEISSQ